MFRLLLYWRPSLVRLSLGALVLDLVLVGSLLARAVPIFWIVAAAAAGMVLPFSRYVAPFYRG